MSVFHRPTRSVLLSACALACAAAAPARAADLTIELRDHHYVPDRIEVPAGQKFRLIVKNTDGFAEEFESHALDREKVIPAGGTITLNLGPLEAGEYPFVGEYHEDSATGVLVAK